MLPWERWQEIGSTSVMENLQISFDDDVVHLVGDLDAETVGLMAGVREFIVGSREPVEIDLDGLTFCDSAGIYELIQLGRIAADSGLDFRLANPHGMVRRIFEVADLGRTLPIVPSDLS
jgi:anti-anti-sigma factor